MSLTYSLFALLYVLVSLAIAMAIELVQLVRSQS